MLYRALHCTCPNFLPRHITCHAWDHLLQNFIIEQPKEASKIQIQKCIQVYIYICVTWGTRITWIEEVHTLSASSQLLESVIGLFIFSGCILSNLSAMISPKIFIHLYLLYLEHKYKRWSIFFISSEHTLTNKYKQIQS